MSDAGDRESFSDQLAEQIWSWTGNRAQVVAIPKKELRRLRDAEESIVANWDQELVVVRGDKQVLRKVV